MPLRKYGNRKDIKVGVYENKTPVRSEIAFWAMGMQYTPYDSIVRYLFVTSLPAIAFVPATAALYDVDIKNMQISI